MVAKAAQNALRSSALGRSLSSPVGSGILSGAIREWLYEPIVDRIIDNKVLPVRPVIKNGNIENLDELGGYRPFLKFVSMKDTDGQPIFPDPMGGGIGIERSLYALLRGEKIEKIDDITKDSLTHWTESSFHIPF